MDAHKDDLETDLKDRVRFETLLADLSARFVKLAPDALDREIEEAQRRICETLGLDRSTLGQPDNAGKPQLTHSWAAPGCTPVPRGQAAPILPWLTARIRAGHLVRFTSVSELPEKAAVDKETLRRVGAKSVLSFPLWVSDGRFGVLAFGTVHAEREWPEILVTRLQLVAEVFANALARRAAEESLRAALAAAEALKEQLQAENVTLRHDLQSLEHDQILGRSAGLRHVLAQVEQVAATDATVLLLGETGTGKELVACAIHELSARARPAHGPGQLRRDPVHAHRERAVRPREGRLHRGAEPADRPLRSRPRLDAVPGRNRRAAAGAAGQAAARARRTGSSSGWAARRRSGGRAHHRRHEPRPGRRRSAKAGSGRTCTTA